MQIFQQTIAPEESCAYLPNRRSRMEYVGVARLAGEEYQQLMDAGWRKFGALLFRPVCAGCTACLSLRVPVAAFTPSRGQRRAGRKCLHLQVRVGPPAVDSQRIDLYNSYHEARSRQKGWRPGSISPGGYELTYVRNPLPALELTLWDQEALRGVVLLDVTPASLSAVYHYYSPELHRLGLGTVLLLRSIELARSLGKSFLYLGYYVKGCPSLEYKSQFRPCEVLDETGRWRTCDERARVSGLGPEPLEPDTAPGEREIDRRIEL